MEEPGEGYRIVLGSGSPRRKELLGLFIKDFTVRVLPDIGEKYPPELPLEEIAGYLSRQKAAAYQPTLGADELLVTADTIVTHAGKVLGKPSSREEAMGMLQELSGCIHEVRTGVSLTSCAHQRSFTATTSVCFANLGEAEIAFYVDTYRPFDKAGAYGIQEWIGLMGVEWVKGSYYNVMGLPTHRLYRELRCFPGVGVNQ
ncbi:MAG: Maf-like protein [Tannerellaceae bacterium]|nr:Maf-like protein [Tannerellaceae bacterium]